MGTIISFFLAHSGLFTFLGGLIANELLAWSKNLKPNSWGQFLYILGKGIVQAVIENRQKDEKYGSNN